MRKEAARIKKKTKVIQKKSNKRVRERSRKEKGRRTGIQTSKEVQAECCDSQLMVCSGKPPILQPSTFPHLL